MTLEVFFKENSDVALGLSGGVDSSFLLYAGLRHGAKIGAYYVKTAFQPEFEYRDALKLAEQLGVKVIVLELDILENEKVASNPHDRCYHCKKAIFGAIQKGAAEAGVGLIIDGTNASDDVSDRPGMRALSELGIRSPLKECGLTKDDIRCLSTEAGLFTWDKPAYACLATRVPFGQTITVELLRQVEGAEGSISALGFTDFRVRIYGGAARLQFTSNQIGEAVRRRSEILAAIRPYFTVVLLDMEER